MLGATEVRWGRRTRRTAPRSTRCGWRAAWPTRSVARGVRLHEHTRVRSIEPGRVVDRPRHGARPDDDPCARPRATPPPCPATVARLAPVYSLVIATEPLSADVWEQIGLRRRETFSDHRHLIIYGQRTADDRLVFGGRGAPYHFGSRIRPGYDRDDRVFGKLRETLVELFPVLERTRITHAWGGALGVPRDWCASVGLDRDDAASAGRAGTSATASAPPTSPGAPCATWCSAATPS